MSRRSVLLSSVDALRLEAYRTAHRSALRFEVGARRERGRLLERRFASDNPPPTPSFRMVRAGWSVSRSCPALRPWRWPLWLLMPGQVTGRPGCGRAPRTWKPRLATCVRVCRADDGDDCRAVLLRGMPERAAMDRQLFAFPAEVSPHCVPGSTGGGLTARGYSRIVRTSLVTTRTIRLADCPGQQAFAPPLIPERPSSSVGVLVSAVYPIERSDPISGSLFACILIASIPLLNYTWSRWQPVT